MIKPLKRVKTDCHYEQTVMINRLPEDVSAVMSGRDSGFIDFDSSDAMSLSTLEVSIAEIKLLKYLKSTKYGTVQRKMVKQIGLDDGNVLTCYFQVVQPHQIYVWTAIDSSNSDYFSVDGLLLLPRNSGDVSSS